MTLEWTKRGFGFVVPVLLVGFATAARAEPTCELRGTVALPKTALLYDAASGGQELARFTGAKVGLTVTSFPESGGGRAGVTTSGFRLKGYLRARDLPVYTVRSVPVVAGHVWIAEGRRVGIVGAGPGKLHVERTPSFPMGGYFHGWAPCDAFSLAERVPSGWTPPGDARGYLAKKARVEFFGEPRGDAVTTLEPAADGPGVLLWGSERRDGFVHVEHHGDIVLDGWVKTGDVTALPPGETMDQVAPSSFQSGTPQLSTSGLAKTVRVTAPVTLRGKATEHTPEIGSIEVGVEILVLDVVAGWASVVPKSLELQPAGANQFWARARDLGL